MATADPTSGQTRPADQNAPAPIIVDLGKRRRKLVRQLRKGTGKLMDEVQSAISEIQRAGRIPANTAPVIVVVTQKTKRGKMFGLPMMC